MVLSQYIYIDENRMDAIPICESGARVNLGQFRAGGIFGTGTSEADHYNGVDASVNSTAIGFAEAGLGPGKVSAMFSTDGIGGQALVLLPEMGQFHMGLGGGALYSHGEVLPTGLAVATMTSRSGFSAFLGARYSRGPGLVRYEEEDTVDWIYRYRSISYMGDALSLGGGVDYTGLEYLGVLFDLEFGWLFGQKAREVNDAVRLESGTSTFIRLGLGFYIKNY